MCDSASLASDEEEVQKTIVIPESDEVERPQRKRASAAAAGIRDELADVVEDELPERSPSPEVTMPDSFGSSISSKPLDPSSIRAIVNTQNENSTSICAPAETSDPPTTLASTSQSVETDNSTETDVTVDSDAVKAPFMLLGVKKTSKDKFYKFDAAMEAMKATIVECNFYSDNGEQIVPFPFELHKLIFSTQASINTTIEEAFATHSGLTELVQKCIQVNRVKKVEGTSETVIEVCLFLRIDPVIVTGLSGEHGNVERFTALRDKHYSTEAGLVVALDKKIVEKISKSPDAHKHLHNSVFFAFSGKRKLGKNKPSVYVKFDELPMGDNREEHDSFLFKLLETKPAVKRVAKTPSTSKSPSGIPKNNFEQMFSGPAPAPAPTPTPTPTPTSPVVNSSVVLHNTEKEDTTKSADESQKEKWSSVGAALHANDGVVKPAQPWAPTMLQLDMPFEKLQVVKGGDGKPILMIYP